MPFERYLSSDKVPGKRRTYLASPRLATAVNTALAAEQPLLIAGEPGVGKTTLAASVAEQLELQLVPAFHTRSDSQAKDVLYHFDALRRLYDVHAQDPRAQDPRNYRQFRALGHAIVDSERERVARVVLVDEIDKAPRDFPNDLLDVIDNMRFTIAETDETYVATVRPIVVITTNRERQLPEAFLRRCIFHFIRFPSERDLTEILTARIPDVTPPLAQRAAQRFSQLRLEHDGYFEKPPATGELLKWVEVLLRAGVSATDLDAPLPRLPYVEALLKTKNDLERLLGGAP